MSEKDIDLKSWFKPLPKNTKAKLGEFVSAEGVIDVQKRYTELPTETIVGLFKREDGASNIANVEHDLAALNGCKVRVKIEVLEVPKEEKGDAT
jgi:hypothetical protein